MKNIKDLQEKLNKLFIEGMSLYSAEEGVETRSLSEEEKTHAKEIRDEIRSLDAQIETEKVSRVKIQDAIVEKRDASENLGEKKDMNKEQEVRSMELYIRNETASDEYRDLTASISAGNATASTPGNGGVTIPKNVASDIIAKLGEQAPVFGLSKQLPSVVGSLTIPRQGSVESSSFTGELENLSQLKPQFETVDLTQKRVGSFIQLTEQLLNDSAVDIVSYSIDYLAASLGAALEKNILVGVPKGFSPVIGHIADENLVTFVDVAAPTVEELIDITNAVNPSYLPGSVFVVSRPVYDIMSKLKDGDGQYLFFRGDTATAGHPTFAGFPVYVSGSLKDNATSQVVFGNFTRGYSVMVKEGIALQMVSQDTTQVLAGGRLLAITGYMDGAVVDPFAFAAAKKA